MGDASIIGYAAAMVIVENPVHATGYIAFQIHGDMYKAYFTQ